jgi:hypothetical protein
MKPAPDNFTVFDDNRSNGRIGRRSPLTSAGQVECYLHKVLVFFYCHP